MQVKRILITYNPISGRGIASKFAADIAATLIRKPCDIEICPTQLADTKIWLHKHLLAKPDAVIVVGGDGTLRQIASALVNTDIPVYHAASGTENLFSKSMSMTSDPSLIISAIEANNVKSIDTAIANEQFMLLMGSVGFDAEVVARLAEKRGSSITHWSYLTPSIQSFFDFNPPIISIEVDGNQLVSESSGWAVVANSKVYARGLNPARDALLTDGELDIVFLPFRRRLQLLRWIQLMRKGTHLHHPNAICARGKQIIVKTTEPVNWQIDGDPVGREKQMKFNIKPKTLTVLEQSITVDNSSGYSNK